VQYMRLHYKVHMFFLFLSYFFIFCMRSKTHFYQWNSPAKKRNVYVWSQFLYFMLLQPGCNWNSQFPCHVKLLTLTLYSWKYRASFNVLYISHSIFFFHFIANNKDELKRAFVYNEHTSWSNNASWEHNVQHEFFFHVLFCIKKGLHSHFWT
jgi:hypothetical protein